jgi:hypothetical protein
MNVCGLMTLDKARPLIASAWASLLFARIGPNNGRRVLEVEFERHITLSCLRFSPISFSALGRSHLTLLFRSSLAGGLPCISSKGRARCNSKNYYIRLIFIEEHALLSYSWIYGKPYPLWPKQWTA